MWCLYFPLIIWFLAIKIAGLYWPYEKALYCEYGALPSFLEVPVILVPHFDFTLAAPIGASSEATTRSSTATLGRSVVGARVAAVVGDDGGLLFVAVINGADMLPWPRPLAHP